MIKIILKRLTSPIGFLLILTLIFGIITLIIQLFLIDIIPLTSSISIIKTINKREYFNLQNINIPKHKLNENLEEESIEILYKFDHNYEKCKNLIRANQELKDLRRIKSSYLNELKQIEIKRNNLLKTINQLQFQVDNYRIELEKLKQKNQLIKYKILNNLFKLNDYDYRLNKDLNSIRILKTSFNLSNEQARLHKTTNDGNFQEIDDWFVFDKCKLNNKLSLYLFKHEGSEFILNSLNLNQLNYSIGLVDEPIDSCLIGVFLLDRANIAYYNELIKFLLEIKRSEFNFILINPIQTQKGLGFKHRVEFKNFIMSFERLKGLKETDLAKFEFEFIGKSLFASFNRQYSTFDQNLDIHFSINLNLLYLNEQSKQHDNILLRYDYKDRKYLLSYNKANVANQKTSFLKGMLQSYSNVLFETSCKPSLDGSGLCHDINKRTSILLESTFTLITLDNYEQVWNAEMTYRLIEALKCSSIPVIINTKLKLPLDDLIAWNEIVIRVPYAHVNYLMVILNGIEQSDLSSRRIKARNIYNSYFSTLTNQFRTLFASVQYRIGLPLYPIRFHYGNEMTNLMMIKSSKEKMYYLNKKRNSSFYSMDVESNYDYNNDEANSYFDNDDGDDDENEFEYLGQINQKPMASEEFKRNFTQNIYLNWNKLYYPFNSFPSLPFESYETSENKYLYSYHNNKQIEFVNSSINSSNYDENVVRFKEYMSMMNNTFGGGDGKFFNHYLSGNLEEEQFTIVILTYKREPILIDLLERYVKVPYLNSIIIVWNSIDTEPSSEFKHKFNLYLSSKRVRVIRSTKNSLNNRFLPYDLIKTDAILSLDDDTMLRPDEIVFAFRVWRENRDRIVGFPARYHAWNFTSNSYVYQSDLSCEYSMILTGAAFYHRFYNYAFSYLMDERIKDKIDEYKNCEDIAFNFLVSHLTRKPPIKVTCKWSFYCTECESLANYGMSNEIPVSLKLGHYERRTQCLKYFISIYGYNPLLYTQFRADSVLFKTKIPLTKQKCFKLI